MKKRFVALLAAVCTALSLTALPASAASGSTALETIQALGILTGDSAGNLNLSKAVTRAEFVTMMTAASPYKDTIGEGSGVALFTDVKSGHWAGEYIRLAVEQGWMSGYVDGTFRPDNPITLEEGCTALLKMLGYDSSALAGSYPAAQLSKASSIGLRDDLSVVKGTTLTRQDCVTLFYNLLVSENSAGVVYGTSLGYTVTNGQVDYSTLVTASTKGPYVCAAAGSLSLPFSSVSAVYRDGVLSSLSAVRQYDVYYYNENIRTVWVYSDKVSGTLTAVSPSSTAPTSVTVAGSTYQLGTSDAVYKCSSQGEFSAGNLVTLLLGMNGEVVDVVSIDSTEAIYYGVVTASEKGASNSTTSSSGSASIQVETQVACTDGTVLTFYTSSGPYTQGALVCVTVEGSGTSIKSLPRDSLEGKVSSDSTSLGEYDFAAGVEILDTDSDGNYVRIYPSRLAGATLKSGDVCGYTLDKNGDIDRLILNQVTGDTYDYVYITAAETSTGEMSSSGSYTYWKDGTWYNLNGNTIYTAKVGGAVLSYRDGEISGIRQLSSVKLTDVGSMTAMDGNETYTISEDVRVLLRGSGTTGYYTTSLSEIAGGSYTLEGWYDDFGCSAGGRIRIIVATPEA